MSSWRSHLPESVRFRDVVGLGLNSEEMADNPQLTRSVVHDVPGSSSPVSVTR